MEAETKRWFLVKVERHKMAKAIVEIENPMEISGFLKANGTQCRFVSLVTKTPVKAIKAKNPWGKGLFKITKVSGIINANYVKSVERRLAEKLGIDVTYNPGQTWYCHLQTPEGKALPLVKHATEDNGKIYLQYFPHRTTSTYITASGEVIPSEDVKPWLYARKEQSEYKPRTQVVELANIKELRASGGILQAEDLDAAEAAFA